MMSNQSAKKSPYRAPLKLVLIVPFVTLATLVVGLVGTISYRSGQQDVNNVARKFRSEMGLRIKDHLQSYLALPHQINRMNAINIAGGILNLDDPGMIRQHLWEQIQIFKSVSSIYVGNEHGGLMDAGRELSSDSQYVIYTEKFKSGALKKFKTDHQGNPTQLLVTVPGFDTRNRQWYIEAENKGGAVWSPIYILSTGQDMAVAASRPVYDEQKNLLGVVAVDLFISHISRFLKKMEIGDGGHAFIMDRAGRLIASTTDEKPFVESDNGKSRFQRIRAAESQTHLIRLAAESMTAGFGNLEDITEGSQLAFELDGQRQFLHALPFRDEYGLDWLIVVVLPESMFMNQIETNNLTTGILILSSLVLFIILAVFISGRISKPIHLLETSARILADGQWTRSISNTSRILEVQNVTASFNRMAEQLNQTLEDLNREVESRKRSEKQFQELFNSIHDLVYTQDMEGSFISVNPAMTNLFEYDRSEFIGRKASDFMKPEFRHLFEEKYLSDIAAKGYNEGVSVYLTKTGEPIYIEYRSSIVTPEDGECYISGTGRDVTQRILSDRRVKMLQEQLLQSQKMESIGTMAGGIAHDFNNILFMITGNAELALEEIPEWHPSHANLEAIKSASLHAAGIVKQLLNFSRKTDETKRPIGAVTVIKDTLTFLRSTIPTSIDIETDLPEKELTILANPTQINQVLMNICTNASHAMEKTGGVLKIDVHKETLTENETGETLDLAAGEYLKIMISDTGPGISSDIIDKIFDPYFTTKEVGKGTGMGLAVVHGIIQNYNGRITVNSRKGEGSTFTIFLPLTDEEPEMEVVVSDQIPHGNETILFVDDEKSIADMAKKMLKRLGYDVATQTNPVDAIALFQEKPGHFDLVITDMTMPQLSGITLLETLRNERPDIPVIVCTGHSSQIDEAKAKRLGIDAYVMKPISRADMAQTIRNVLDRKESLR